MPAPRPTPPVPGAAPPLPSPAAAFLQLLRIVWVFLFSFLPSVAIGVLALLFAPDMLAEPAPGTGGAAANSSYILRRRLARATGRALEPAPPATDNALEHDSDDLLDDGTFRRVDSEVDVEEVEEVEELDDDLSAARSGAKGVGSASKLSSSSGSTRRHVSFADEVLAVTRVESGSRGRERSVPSRESPRRPSAPRYRGGWAPVIPVDRKRADTEGGPEKIPPVAAYGKEDPPIAAAMAPAMAAAASAVAAVSAAAIADVGSTVEGRSAEVMPDEVRKLGPESADDAKVNEAERLSSGVGGGAGVGGDAAEPSVEQPCNEIVKDGGMHELDAEGRDEPVGKLMRMSNDVETRFRAPGDVTASAGPLGCVSRDAQIGSAERSLSADAKSTEPVAAPTVAADEVAAAATADSQSGSSNSLAQRLDEDCVNRWQEPGAEPVVIRSSTPAPVSDVMDMANDPFRDPEPLMGAEMTSTSTLGNGMSGETFIGNEICPKEAFLPSSVASAASNGDVVSRSSLGNVDSSARGHVVHTQPCDGSVGGGAKFDALHSATRTPSSPALPNECGDGQTSSSLSAMLDSRKPQPVDPAPESKPAVDSISVTSSDPDRSDGLERDNPLDPKGSAALHAPGYVSTDSECSSANASKTLDSANVNAETPVRKVPELDEGKARSMPSSDEAKDTPQRSGAYATVLDSESSSDDEGAAARESTALAGLGFALASESEEDFDSQPGSTNSVTAGKIAVDPSGAGPARRSPASARANDVRSEKDRDQTTELLSSAKMTDVVTAEEVPSEGLRAPQKAPLQNRGWFPPSPILVKTAKVSSPVASPAASVEIHEGSVMSSEAAGPIFPSQLSAGSERKSSLLENVDGEAARSSYRGDEPQLPEPVSRSIASSDLDVASPSSAPRAVPATVSTGTASRGLDVGDGTPPGASDLDPSADFRLPAHRIRGWWPPSPVPPSLFERDFAASKARVAANAASKAQQSEACPVEIESKEIVPAPAPVISRQPYVRGWWPPSSVRLQRSPIPPPEMSLVGTSNEDANASLLRNAGPVFPSDDTNNVSELKEDVPKFTGWTSSTKGAAIVPQEGVTSTGVEAERETQSPAIEPVTEVVYHRNRSWWPPSPVYPPLFDEDFAATKARVTAKAARAPTLRAQPAPMPGVATTAPESPGRTPKSFSRQPYVRGWWPPSPVRVASTRVAKESPAAPQESAVVPQQAATSPVVEAETKAQSSAIEPAVQVVCHRSLSWWPPSPVYPPLFDEDFAATKARVTAKAAMAPAPRAQPALIPGVVTQTPDSPVRAPKSFSRQPYVRGWWPPSPVRVACTQVAKDSPAAPKESAALRKATVAEQATQESFGCLEKSDVNWMARRGPDSATAMPSLQLDASSVSSSATACFPESSVSDASDQGRISELAGKVASTQPRTAIASMRASVSDESTQTSPEAVEKQSQRSAMDHAMNGNDQLSIDTRKSDGSAHGATVSSATVSAVLAAALKRHKEPDSLPKGSPEKFGRDGDKPEVVSSRDTVHLSSSTEVPPAPPVFPKARHESTTLNSSATHLSTAIPLPQHPQVSPRVGATSATVTSSPPVLQNVPSGDVPATDDDFDVDVDIELTEDMSEYETDIDSNAQVMSHRLEDEISSSKGPSYSAGSHTELHSMLDEERWRRERAENEHASIAELESMQEAAKASSSPASSTTRTRTHRSSDNSMELRPQSPDERQFVRKEYTAAGNGADDPFRNPFDDDDARRVSMTGDPFMETSENAPPSSFPAGSRLHSHAAITESHRARLIREGRERRRDSGHQSFLGYDIDEEDLPTEGNAGRVSSFESGKLTPPIPPGPSSGGSADSSLGSGQRSDGSGRKRSSEGLPRYPTHSSGHSGHSSVEHSEAHPQPIDNQTARRLLFSRPAGPSKEVAEVKDSMKKIINRIRPSSPQTNSQPFASQRQSLPPSASGAKYASPRSNAPMDAPMFAGTAPAPSQQGERRAYSGPSEVRDESEVSQQSLFASAPQLPVSHGTGYSVQPSERSDQAHESLYASAPQDLSLSPPVHSRSVASVSPYGNGRLLSSAGSPTKTASLTQFVSNFSLVRTSKYVGRILTQIGCTVAVKKSNNKMKVEAPYGARGQVLHASISMQPLGREPSDFGPPVQERTMVTVMRSKEDRGRTEVHEFVSFYHVLRDRFEQTTSTADS